MYHSFSTWKRHLPARRSFLLGLFVALVAFGSLLHAGDHIETEEELVQVLARVDNLGPREAALAHLDAFAFFLMKRDYAHAWEQISEAEGLITGLGGPIDLRARLELARARVKMQQGRLTEAMQAAQEAQSLAARSTDAEVEMQILHTIGNGYMLIRDYPRALDHFLEAVTLAKSLDDGVMRGRILNSIAISYWRMKEWDSAERYLREAQSLQAEGSHMYYLFANNIGVALMEQRRYAEAEAHLLEALAFNEALNSPQALGLNQSNLGDLYTRMGNLDRAEAYLKEALALEKTQEHLYLLTRSHRHMARLHAARGQLDEAMAEVREAISMAREIQDPAEEMDSWEALIRISEEAGLYQEALNAYRKMEEIEEQLLSEQTRARSELFKAQFASAATEAQIEVLEGERILDQLYRNILIACLALVILVAISIALRYRTLHRLHNQITTQKDEIEKNHEELQAINDKLSRLNVEKDEILGIAAHDLRNPVGAIFQLGNLLREDKDLDEHMRSEIEADIVRSAQAVLDILNKLLGISQIEEGAIHLSKARIQPDKLVASTVERFKEQAVAKNQHIKGKASPDCPDFLSDPTILEQVCSNLVSNAIKYSPRGATVRLSLDFEASGSSVILKVMDEGPGLSEADQKKLFGKFARLTPKPTGGEPTTGLGLYIVSKLVQLLGGTITCQSQLGKGTTFTLQLPHEAPEAEANPDA